MKKENKKVYKSIKVPRWVHENSKQVSLILSRKGIKNLPKEVLSPKYCPICKSEMEELGSKCSYKQCPSCGYTQKNFKDYSNFLKGVVIGDGIGLGISLLIYFLSNDNKVGRLNTLKSL